MLESEFFADGSEEIGYALMLVFTSNQAHH
jgi:hypothetical protein